ncbi:MAG: glycosyltransferase family 9 protein, partial [Spirochaetes bacterium]|nr:glycosyltransferase family 9 protein [Spirochaetota bacterium]
SALRVRALKPEMVLQLETNDVMALWSFFSGAKRRVGIRRQTFGRLFNLHNALQEGGQSALLFYLGFLDALGEEADGFRTELFAAEKKVPARPPVVFIHPGARLAERLWPAACWVELIALIRKQYPQVKIRIARSRFDAAVCAELFALVPRSWHCEWREIHDFAGLCAATADASLALTLDSAPRHVAAAYDIPTVSLLAHWIVKDWGIYDDARHGVVLSHTARPDYGIHTIPVAAVFAEFVKRFGKSGRRRKK